MFDERSNEMLAIIERNGNLKMAGPRSANEIVFSILGRTLSLATQALKSWTCLSTANGIYVYMKLLEAFLWGLKV